MAQNRGVRSSSVVFPLLLITFGILVLISRAYPNFDPWPVLRSFWPLILIFIGAGMIWDRSRRPANPDEPAPFPVGSTLGALFFILILLALIWHHRSYTYHDTILASRSLSHHHQVVETNGAKAVRMSVKMPAGELRIDGGADQVLDADFGSAVPG